MPEEPIPDPSVCFGFGYSESKWVGEQIVYHASQSTGLRATSVRVGILCGDRNGHWNTSELYPSVVKSALELRYLPNTEVGRVCSFPRLFTERIESGRAPTMDSHIRGCRYTLCDAQFRTPGSSFGKP